MKPFLQTILFLSILTPFVMNDCYTQNQDTVKNTQNFETVVFDYPKTTYPVNSFELIKGIPVIPLYNGLFAAGKNLWIKQPEGENVLSLCTSIVNNSIYYITQDSVGDATIHQKFPKSENVVDSVLKKFRKGYFQIKSVGIDTLVLWGIQDSLFKVKYLLKDTVIDIYSSKNPFTDVFPVSSSVIIIAFDYDIFLLSNVSEPKRIISSEYQIESITFNEEGTIFISTEVGIFTKEKKSGKLVPLIVNTHGILKSSKKGLFILQPDNFRILLFNLE